MRPVPPDVCEYRRARRHASRSGLGAMSAALVIVPAHPDRASSASAHSGRGLRAAAVGPRVVPSGSPWMVRLSMGCGDATSADRLAPARKHRPGSHR
jgi:hypothetical protein